MITQDELRYAFLVLLATYVGLRILGFALMALDDWLAQFRRDTRERR